MSEKILINALRDLSGEQIQGYCDLLPEKQKLVLSLTIFEMMNFNEISQILDMPKKDIRNLFMDSMKRLCIHIVN